MYSFFVYEYECMSDILKSVHFFFGFGNGINEFRKAL